MPPEELLEKRCLARQFCPSQARKFYGTRGETDTGTDLLSPSSAGSPKDKPRLEMARSLWAEAFALAQIQYRKRLNKERPSSATKSRII